MKKAKTPTRSIAPAMPEDAAAKLLWMRQQQAFILNKPYKTDDDLAWLRWAEDRLITLKLAVA